jgi:hypothetical protein
MAGVNNGMKRVLCCSQINAVQRQLCTFAAMSQLSGKEAPAGNTSLKIVFGISVPLVWVSALFVPSYSDGTPGIMCFLMGWLMLFSGNIFAFAAWTANLPFWISFFLLIFGKRRGSIKAALILAATAVIFSPGAFSVNEIMQNEGGTTTSVYPATGSYVWVASNILLLVWAATAVKREPQ